MTDAEEHQQLRHFAEESPRSNLYSRKDVERAIAYTRKGKVTQSAFLSPFAEDVSRVIHSPCFRRLQGKCQLFPNSESEFFRTRLTHTIEVAQIAKMLAYRLNSTRLATVDMQIDPNVVEFAALCHDLGHPPFGHTGEEALDEMMRKHGGFEGNAQTFRIIAFLEKREFKHVNESIFDAEGNDLRVGLNITYRGLASVLKYDQVIPAGRDENSSVMKGYYESEAPLVDVIKHKVLDVESLPESFCREDSFKTIECQIMDIADDIAYSTFDLEDACESGLVSLGDLYYPHPRTLDQCSASLARRNPSYTPERILSVLRAFVEQAREFLPQEHRNGGVDREGQQYLAFREISTNAYARTQFMGSWVRKLVDSIDVQLNTDYPVMSLVTVGADAQESIDVLKHFTFNFLTLSPRLQHVDYRGKTIVKTIFDAVAKNWQTLLPLDFQEIVRSYPVPPGDRRRHDDHRMRTVCDYVATMSDRECPSGEIPSCDGC